MRPLRNPIGMTAAARVALATALVAGALASTAAGRAADFGANDDTPKFQPDGGAAFFGRMAAGGLRQVVLTVRWTPSRALDVPNREKLERAVEQAVEAGIRPVLATYPYPPAELEQGLGTPAAFAAWLGEVAEAFPAVRTYVVLNEPNQPAFLRPQFDAAGANASARRAGQLLAAGYDALKAVDPTITVVGLGLSPRGNDRPAAANNISTSPVRFLQALGEWYRASGRTRPLMDGLSFHPYPNTATDPLERGYAWPNAGFVDLDRIRQAMWDAFAGTPQPTTTQGLRLYLDEVGWQVDTSSQPGYVGVENVAVTSEQAQSAVYGQLVRRALCDPDLATVNFFGFYDDAERVGFQSALHRVDGAPRPAAATVASALADGRCDGEERSWEPAAGLAGPVRVQADWDGVEETLRLTLRVAEGAEAVACVLPGTVSSASVRRRLAPEARPTGCATARLVPGRRGELLVRLPPRGAFTVGIRLGAVARPSRATALAY